MKRTSILLIYTGGTIGMKQDPVTSVLAPFNFSQILEEVPELNKFGCIIDTFSFDPAIDSSDAEIPFWVSIAEIIYNSYEKYDGFVVLHGTDTMSYTASALSFMFENLEKPIILTGSQLPIGMLRTDGKENLITAIEIASCKREDGRAMVPEVCIYFNDFLYRGNRTTKYSAENFRAFESANYPALAEVGINIKFKEKYINYPENWGKELKLNTSLDPNVAILKIFPSIRREVLDSVISTPNLRAIILETYGSGNAPTGSWFLNSIKNAVDKGLIVMNITQCLGGSVDMDAYATGVSLKKEGVINGHDSTTEAAISKLFFLLGQYTDISKIKVELGKNLRGEISKY